MYVESRKTVQTNLLAKQKETDVENKCVEAKGRKGQVGQIARLRLTHVHCCVQREQLLRA